MTAGCSEIVKLNVGGRQAREHRPLRPLGVAAAAPPPPPPPAAGAWLTPARPLPYRRLFVTTRTTLTKFGSCMLAGMFRGDFPAGTVYEGGVFIDR